MYRQRFINLIVLLTLLLATIAGPVSNVKLVQAAGIPRADALVLVNSLGVAYDDFTHFVQPYLDHFGVPYTLLDIATAPVDADLGDYALLIIGHRQLDPNHLYLDTAEQANISAAVNAGTGLVNFDNNLSTVEGVPHYQFTQDIFNFGYEAATNGSGVAFPAGTAHYITERHDPGSSISTGNMNLAGITLPVDVTAIALTGSQPFLAVTNYGTGRAVQWGSYDWMSVGVKGPVFGLDDLVWHSLVWAARKPFVMQGMPPFVTMRSDDESGNFEWIHIANEFGIKPWSGLFYKNIDEAEAADLSSLTRAGLATASVHAFDGSFFYFNHSGLDFPDSTMAENYADGTAWHLAHNIPISDYVLPHYYEFGTNVFQGLSDWGVEFVGTHMEPGNGYGAPWVMNGPFRSYETGGSSGSQPVYYADYMTIPGHTEFDGKFFNCVTEIRDDAGYEWYPDLNNVQQTIDRGTRQTIRALDGMNLATLFTHGYFISGSWNASAPANWRAILQAITTNIKQYDPIYVTMDDACRYIRATHDSNITSATYDASTRQVTANFNTVSGISATDVETMFYVYMDGEASVLVDVPVFTGATTVAYTIPGPLDHILVEPNTTSVVAGASRQFTATGYDAENHPIPNMPVTWSVANGGGVIDPTGLFTAGLVTGSYANTVVATRAGISGSATVEVTTPVIDHFEFAPVGSPKYAGSPFSVTIRARDAAGNLVVGYTGMAALSASSGTISPAATGPFSGGVWSGQVTVDAVSSGVVLTASDGNFSGNSTSFAVQASPTCPCSIWDTSTVPSIPHNADPEALEAGVKFRAATDGTITALRVYRGATNLNTPFDGHLWTAGGALLATVNFPAATSAGWQQAALPAGVQISADTTYVASYYTLSGYAVSRPYFTTANQSAYERPPLRALADGEQGPNGVYIYGPSGTFPTSTYQSTNYWVDVVFETVSGPDTTPPTVISRLPAAGAEGINPGGDVTATFSEAVQPTTISAAAFELRDPDGALVPAAVTYDTSTYTARLNPNAALQYATTYTATVKGQTDGVADLAGNLLTADDAWPFTTSAAPPSLDHFEISAISTPQISGVPFAVTITARDTAGGINSAYTGRPSLSASSGSISPLQTVAFTGGVWSGQVTIFTASSVSGVTITATDGSVSGQSSVFDLQPSPAAPPFYTVTTASDTQTQGVPFTVNVTVYSGLTINAWEDNHQDPILVTTSELTPLNTAGETDGKWTEFLYPQTRDYPSILAAVNEEDYGLPTLRFYAGSIPNGKYQVLANLYDNAPMRYYFGYTASDPKAQYIDTPGGAAGTQHREYSLGTITITDEMFNVYVRDADLRPGGEIYPFFGWAGLRLVPITDSDQTINLWEDNHQEPVLPTIVDPLLIIGTDGLWTEFLYTTSRPYPTILAGVDEEANGLPTLRFYSDGLPNGEYELFANLYDNSPMRYYYGYSASDPKAQYIDTPGGAAGTQHREYSLGKVSITDGSFNLYVRDADMQPGGTYPFFGWASVRLSSSGVALTSNSPTMLFDGDSDNIFGEPEDNIKHLSSGATSISARDTTPGNNILITASDTTGHSGQHSVTVLSANQPPVAVADSYTTNKDTVLTVAAPGVLGNDSDADGNPLTATLVAGPAHGTLALQPNGAFTYTPASGYFGMDAFTYRANDGTTDSPTASVQIRVNSSSLPPVLPSSFYGTLYYDAQPPAPGTLLQVRVAGISTPIATAALQQSGANLVYQLDVPGDALDTALKEGGVEGEALTFSIDGRVVAHAVWRTGANTRVDVHAVTLDLQSGWNLISFELQPAEPAIAAVLASMDGKYDLVYAWDGASQSWLKYDNVPLSSDSLERLDEKMGVWVHVTEAAVELQVVGSLPSTTAIGLVAGWNLVGYPSGTAGSVPASFPLVYAYHAADAGDPWKMYDRQSPAYVNDLSQLTSGWGYWVQAESASTWQVSYSTP